MISVAPERTASIHLDYGVDSASFDFEDLYICRRGLQMKTRWYFDPGAELSVNFQWSDGSHGAAPRLLRTQGVVAECERCGEGQDYQVTVLFLEMTDDIRAAIWDLTGVAA
jgi:hypothetical protein